MKDEIQLLSTARLDDALIEKAAYKNIIIDAVPFIEIKKLVTTEGRQQIEMLSLLEATVVFTSIHSVEVVIDLLPKESVMPPWKIYCIGGATFTFIKKYWSYSNIRFTAKNATALAQQIIADKAASIVFFCGNQRREELPALLKHHEVELQEIVVYETLETPVKMHKNYHGILFFSPSAVTSFFSNNNIGTETVLFAIGNTTTAAIKPFSSNHIVTSDFPAKDQLVNKAIAYFEK